MCTPPCAAAAAALCNAAAAGNVAELRMLVSDLKYDVNAVGYAQRTALHAAASAGHAVAVEALIDHLGAHRSPVDHRGRTPLDDAVEALQSARAAAEAGAAADAAEAVVSSLESRVARTAARRSERAAGDTEASRFVDAAAVGDVELLREIFEAHHATTTLEGRTSAAGAEGTRATAAVGPLGERGVDVAPGSDGLTALHLAALEGRLRVVTLLVEECGADALAVDRWGETPLAKARAQKHAAVIEYLEMHVRSLGRGGFKSNGELRRAARLCRAARRGDVAALRSLVASDARTVDDHRRLVNVCDYDRRSALHTAAASGHAAAVECLLHDLGATPSLYDRWGRTPLDAATVRLASREGLTAEARRGAHEVCELLVAAGAEKAAEAGGDGGGEAALHAALPRDEPTAGDPPSSSAGDRTASSSNLVESSSTFRRRRQRVSDVVVASLLCEAAHVGDVDWLRTLLAEAGAHRVNAADCDGRRAL